MLLTEPAGPGGLGLGSAGECARLGPPRTRGLLPLRGVITSPSWDQGPSKSWSLVLREMQPEMEDVAECRRPSPSQ